MAILRDNNEISYGKVYWRLAESIACIIGMFYQDDNTYTWLLQGWALAAGAFALSYLFEPPIFGLEFTLIAVYYYLMKDAVWHFSSSNLGPAFVAILMLFDLIHLVMYKY